MNKVRTTININKDVVKEAKELDINISAFTEQKLVEYIAYRKGIVSKDCNLDDDKQSKNNKWTCRDLNPRPPPCQGGDLPN